MSNNYRKYNSLSAKDKEKYAEYAQAVDKTAVFNDEALAQFNRMRATDETAFTAIPDIYGLTPSTFEPHIDNVQEWKEAIEAHIKENTSQNMSTYVLACLNLYAVRRRTWDFKWEPDWDKFVITSLIAINEFIQNGESETYDKFYQTNETAIQEMSKNLTLKEYGHTTQLVELFIPLKEVSYMTEMKTNPFLIAGNSSKKHREMIGALTVKNFCQVLKTLQNMKDSGNPHGRCQGYHLSSRGAFEYKVQEIIKDSILSTPTPSVNTTQGNLVRAFSVSYANSPHWGLPVEPMRFLALISDYISKIVMAENLAHTKINTPLTTRLDDIAKFLAENGSSFTGVEMGAIIYSFSARSCFCNGGSTDEYLSLIESAIDRDTEDALSLFKLIADVALNYSDSLPTMKEWSEITTGSIIALSSIAVPLALSPSSAEKKRNVISNLLELRKFAYNV